MERSWNALVGHKWNASGTIVDCSWDASGVYIYVYVYIYIYTLLIFFRMDTSLAARKLAGFLHCSEVMLSTPQNQGPLGKLAKTCGRSRKGDVMMLWRRTQFRC